MRAAPLLCLLTLAACGEDGGPVDVGQAGACALAALEAVVDLAPELGAAALGVWAECVTDEELADAEGVTRRVYGRAVDLGALP